MGAVKKDTYIVLRSVAARQVDGPTVNPWAGDVEEWFVKMIGKTFPKTCLAATPVHNPKTR